MKILKESKEPLPIEFLTTFVSEGWDRVGVLKAQIDAIKSSFTGTTKIAEILQNLVDSYLVCIGQVEQHLNNKDYLDMPAETVKESLIESTCAQVDEKLVDDGTGNTDNFSKDMSAQDIANKHQADIADINTQIERGTEVEHEHTSDDKVAERIAMDHVAEIPDYYDRLDAMETEAENEFDSFDVADTTKTAETKEDSEPFEYFVDFEEPAPITDMDRKDLDQWIEDEMKH